MTTGTLALTREELDQYARDGYLAFDRLVPAATIDALVQRAADRIVEPIPGVAIQKEPAVARGEVQAQSPLDSVRKIEKLAIHDDLYRTFMSRHEVFSRVQAILGEHVKLFRDALMMKPARHGSEKPYHQDNAYWQVEPMDLCSAWIAFDDATLENGCMRVIPGSHLHGVIEHVGGEHLRITDDRIDFSKEIAVPLKKGGVLLFHSLLLHATSPNNSDKSRRAMIYSYMRADTRWTGDPAQEPEFPVLS